MQDILINFDSSCADISDFYPFKVVGRGSETQPKMGKHLNYSAPPLI